LRFRLDRVLNGLTRPFFGWVSDHSGRERTMFIAFLAEAAGITLLIVLAHVPVLFVVLSGLVFFAWGEIYSLFPAIAGDRCSTRRRERRRCWYRSEAGSRRPRGTWMPIFLVAIVFDVTAAVLALFVLKPLCVRVLALGSPSAAAASAVTRPVSASR